MRLTAGHSCGWRIGDTRQHQHARLVQTGADVMIGGFIIEGNGPKTVIVRAIGPELTRFGVPNALADPALDLHNSTGALIASNNNWQTTVIGGIINSD